MGHSPRPDRVTMCIARTMERLNVSAARMRETDALLNETRERLALVRLVAQPRGMRGMRDLPGSTHGRKDLAWR
jgi:hypothetical protein